MLPALVLDGDERSALAVTRSLGRRGVPVTVAAPGARSLAGASRHAARRLVVPDVRRDPDGFAAALLAAAARPPDQVLFPLTDASLTVVDSMRDRLGAVRLPVASSESLALAWDKGRLLAVAAGAGVAAPRTWMPATGAEVAALAAELPYPVVLKPRRSRLRTAQGFVSGEVAYVHTAAELVPAYTALAARLAAPLIQERVPGYGMGVFLLADRGRVLARFAHRRLREKPPAGGVSVLCESIAVPPALAAAADRLLAALEWHGVCMIEFKMDARDGVPRLMEINPRFWGSLALAVDAGVDFPWLLYQLATGPPPALVTSYRLGVRSRWELGDLDHLLIRLRARGERDLPPGAPSVLRTLLAFLNPLAGRPEVLRPSDPGPAFHELGCYVRDLCARRPAGDAA
jgi:predicted ATP-grasp superfamily ATP-dependent carboligase